MSKTKAMGAFAAMAALSPQRLDNEAINSVARKFGAGNSKSRNFSAKKRRKNRIKNRMAKQSRRKNR